MDVEEREGFGRGRDVVLVRFGVSPRFFDAGYSRGRCRPPELLCSNVALYIGLLSAVELCRSLTATAGRPHEAAKACWGTVGRLGSLLGW